MVQSWTVHAINHAYGLDIEDNELTIHSQAQSQLTMNLFVSCLFYAVTWGQIVENSDGAVGIATGQLYETLIKELADIQTGIP
jgi:hypothetical protein